jgi:hypothetical protein
VLFSFLFKCPHHHKCFGINAAPLIYRDPPQLQSPETFDPALLCRKMPTAHPRPPSPSREHEFPNHAGQTEVVSSSASITFSTSEFQMLIPAHTMTSQSVQLAIGMNLPRIACVDLLLNLTMTTPLATRIPWQTTGPPATFYQCNSATEMALPALPCLALPA